MKPIETIYKGFRFRSRLEARWAVFYDTLGIQWEYEKEGFDLGNGIFYLPDFYIPHLNCWIEIKGENQYDSKKIDLFASQSNSPIYVFYGQIPDSDRLECSGPPSQENESAYLHDRNAWDLHHVWCECPDCGFLGIEFDARTDRLFCKKKCPKHGGNEDKGYNGNSERLKLAYNAARYARFEFMEG